MYASFQAQAANLCPQLRLCPQLASAAFRLQSWLPQPASIHLLPCTLYSLSNQMLNHHSNHDICAAGPQDKGSPALPSQDTQPLAELAQNQFPPPPQHDFLAPSAAASKWGPYDRMHAGHGDSDLLVQPQQHALQQPEAFLLSPEPASPQSMELTNDTLQGPGAMGFPGFSLRDENDSLVFHGGHAAAAAAGQDLHGGTGLFAGRDGTYNITGDVPSE